MIFLEKRRNLVFLLILLGRPLWASYVYPPQTVDWTATGTATETAEVKTPYTATVSAPSHTTYPNGYAVSAPFTFYEGQYVTVWKSPDGVNLYVMPGCSGYVSVTNGTYWLGAGTYCLWASCYYCGGSASLTYYIRETKVFSDSALNSGVFDVSYDTTTGSFVSVGKTAYQLVFKRPDGTVADGTLTNVMTSHGTTNPDVILGRTGTTSGTLSAVITKTVYMNDPPPAPAYSSATAAVPLHSLASPVELRWDPVADPNGDPVAYRVFFGTSAPGLPVVQESTATAYLAVAASFGTTYYWQVASVDSPGLASTGPVAAFQVSFSNWSPGPFRALTGQGVQFTRGNSALLSWEAATDPDGDSVSYRFYLGTDRTSVEAGLNEAALSTNSYLLSGLSYGTTYYWRALAEDSYGARTEISGGVRSYLAFFDNAVPKPAADGQTELPSGDIRTSGNSLRLSWPAYEDPDGDPVTYTLSAGSYRSETIYQGQGTSFVLSGLSYRVPYSYKIEVRDDQGGLVLGPYGTFQLVPNASTEEPYNYPNPFRIGEGTNLVFTAPSRIDRLKVSVYSVYQHLVWEKETGPLESGVHQIAWDGRDLNGRAVYSGLYVGVFESPLGRQTTRLVGVR